MRKPLRKMTVRNNLLLFIALLPHLIIAQVRTDTLSTTLVNNKKLYGLTIGAGVGYGAAMFGLSELWYKNTARQEFHFFNDNAEWKQMDKLGHFYSAFYSSYASSNALQWCDVNKRKSDLIGSLTGFLVMVPIEILDGFSSAYGASTGDLLADAGGATFFLAQSLVWNQIRIYPKFSFHKTNFAQLRPNVLGDHLASEVLKDYNGQTQWLSIDMDKFITFPKWLNLAIGYGAQGMVYARDAENSINNYDAYRQYYFSIDFDLTSIHTKSKALKTLIFIANMIKLPAPAIEFSRKGVHFYGVYF